MAKNPIGSGPYKFKKWAQGDKIEFEAYDGYYQGAPAIKNLTYSIIPNSSTAALALESGEIDMSLNVATADIKAMKDKKRNYFVRGPIVGVLFYRHEHECGQAQRRTSAPGDFEKY